MSRIFACLLSFYVLLIFPGIGLAEFLRVSLLGTGSPRIDTDRAGPSVLLEVGGKTLLFDAGRGVVQRLTQLEIPIAKINTVFLTHLHSDHLFALDDLWITGWVYQRAHPLEVFGPVGSANLIEGLKQAYTYDINIRNQYSGLDKNAIRFVANEIEPGVVYSQDRVKVTAFIVDHGAVSPAYGYRIDFGDRTVVISGDTTYSESLVDHARGADVLIHEILAAHPDLLRKNRRLQRIERYHTNLEQMSRILDETRPKLTVLTHVILAGMSRDAVMQRLRQTYDGEVHMGEDLTRIEVGSRVRMLPFKGPRN